MPKDATKDNKDQQTTPADLIKSAAPEDQSQAAPAQEPSSVDDGNPVEMLVALLQQDPELAGKVADLIEQHYGGGTVNDLTPGGGMPHMAHGDMGDMGGMGSMGGPVGPIGPMAPAGPAGPPGVAPPMAGPTPAAVPPELIDRLNRLEQSHANMALDKELADAKQEYAALKEQIPILPDLNDNELLQIALDKGGLPLKDALALWAVQKMREGEGTVADRIMAAMMEKSKAKGLPSPEGKGGAIPSGEAQPPQSLKEARSLAKDRLKALFSSMPG